MDTKKKLIIAIISVSVVLAVLITALTIVLVSGIASNKSNVVVRFEAEGVSCIVAANYTFAGNTYVMYNSVDNSNTVVFNQGVQGSSSEGVLKPNRSFTLNDENSSVVFEYIFVNTSNEVNIELNITDYPVNDSNNNIGYKYLIYDTKTAVSTDLASYQDFLYNGNEISNTFVVGSSNDTASSEKYLYIIAYVKDTEVSASCSGGFEFSLKIQ